MRYLTWLWRAGCLALCACACRAPADTLRASTKYLTFPSALATNYPTGFDYSSGGGASMATDQAGNVHIATTAGNVGHIGYAQYRRWTHASASWSGPVLTFEGTAASNDNFYALIAVDDANRVHALYYHRLTTNNVSSTEPYGLYHRWCTNASGSTPLTLANWNRTRITTIPDNTLVEGSLVNIGSNLLLYARGVDVNGDSKVDIRIDRAIWNGTSWDWEPVGTNGAAIINTTTGYQYGGFYAPVLTYDALNGLLHLHYRQEVYPRLQAYAVSNNPTNPSPETWTTPVLQGAISSNNNEGNGGVGILADGRAIALVYLGVNRDSMGTAVTNFTRIRSKGMSGAWSPWEVTFPGDTRNLGSSLGYRSPSAFASDGYGGLFMVTGSRLMSHWDPKTATWADVFTNMISSGVDSTAVSGLG